MLLIKTTRTGLESGEIQSLITHHSDAVSGVLRLNYDSSDVDSIFESIVRKLSVASHPDTHEMFRIVSRAGTKLQLTGTEWQLLKW